MEQIVLAVCPTCSLGLFSCVHTIFTSVGEVKFGY